MPGLGLLIWLLAAPTVDADVASAPRPGPCELARQIASQGPCLRPEDCGAYRGWKRLFGTPRTEPLDPQAAVLGDWRPDELPSVYLCPAAERAAAHRPDPR